MRIAISTGWRGRLATVEAIRAIAAAAEHVGYAGVWAFDDPDPSPLGPSGPPPNPLEVLAALAGATRVGLGAGLRAERWSQPAELARAVSALPALGATRLTVSLAARGAGRARRVAAVLDAFDTPATSVAPRPQFLLDALTAAELELVAARGDGWSPWRWPPDRLSGPWARIRDRAARLGRDADRLQLVVCSELVLTDRPVEGVRSSYQGSAEQVAEDLHALRRVGADEVVLALAGDPRLGEALDGYARVAEAASL